jgi:hypothetical protein
MAAAGRLRGQPGAAEALATLRAAALQDAEGHALRAALQRLSPS